MEVVVTLVDGRVDIEVVPGSLEYAFKGSIVVFVTSFVVFITPDGRVAVDISDCAAAVVVVIAVLGQETKDFSFGCCEGTEVGLVACTVARMSTFMSSSVLRSS